jgi:hypothetical protein
METPMSDQTPAEIDAELARLWQDEQKAKAYAASYRGHATKLKDAKYAVMADEYDAKAADLRSQAAPFEAEFRRRGGWLRYFLVQNGNGHVHRGMDCSTCYMSTQFSWLIELADCDEAEMIVEFGEKACTVCFPDAPANPAFHAPGRRDAGAIAARQAEKAEKAAAKAAKALPGGPVEGSYSTVTTKVAARNELSSAVQSYGFYGASRDYEGIARRMIEALAGTEIDTATVIERAAKKALKDGGTHDIRKALAA